MSYIDEARRVRSLLTKIIQEADDKTASELPSFAAILKEDGQLISAGTRINYNGVLKRAAVDLWDRPEYNPDNAPNLWYDIQYKDGIRVIPQTIFSTEAFSLGELGWWEGKIYKSLVNSNVYNPSQYAANWAIIEK